MRKITLIAALLMLGFVCQAKAESGSSASTNVSLLASNWGVENSVELTVPSSNQSLQGLEGIVHIVINSDAACSTIVAPNGWEPVVMTNTGGGNFCSRIYEHTFASGEGANSTFTFSWTDPKPFTAKLLSLTDVSGADTSSAVSGYGKSWSVPPVSTNYTGELLIGFYMNSSNAAWTPPSDMVVVHENSSRGGYPDLMTQAWQESRGTSGSFEASAVGLQWGIGQVVAFRPPNTGSIATNR